MVLAVGSPAFAGDCAAAYTVDALISDLTLTETHLRNSDDSSAAQIGATLGAGLACLDEPLPSQIAARAYRAVGAGLYVGGQIDEAKKWLFTSLEIDAAYAYGLEDLPADHPLRQDFESYKSMLAGELEPVEGKVFIEGKHYLNGRKIVKPAARPGRYHIYQVDAGGFQTHRIEGNAFPASSLAAAPEAVVAKGKTPKGGKAPKEPKTKQPKEAKVKEPKPAREKKPKKPKTRTRIINGQEVVIDARERPPEKIPLLIAGGALIAGSGVLAYLAADAKGDMRTVRGLDSGKLAELNMGYAPPTPPHRSDDRVRCGQQAGGL